MEITEEHRARSRAYSAQGWRSLDHEKLASWQEYSAPACQLAAIARGQEPIRQAPLGCMGLPQLINLGIDGYLNHHDALKIYELAFGAPGDVLELGTFRGLSTSIIARALEDRRGGSLETVDMDGAGQAIARGNLDGRPGADRITFTVKDAAARLDELIQEGRRFGYVFVDHWHGYQATVDACKRLADVMVIGGYVQFHDFLTAQNFIATDITGVYVGVLDTLCRDDRFEFAGLAGCCGIFRRV